MSLTEADLASINTIIRDALRYQFGTPEAEKPVINHGPFTMPPPMTAEQVARAASRAIRNLPPEDEGSWQLNPHEAGDDD